MTTHTPYHHACQLLCDAADWQRPELAALAARFSADAVEELAPALIRHLRERQAPLCGYSADYVRALRAASTEEQRLAARERITAQLAPDAVHHSLFHQLRALSPTDLQLGASPEIGARLAAIAWDAQAQWGEWLWWQANCFMHLLRALWPLEEIADRELLPILCWMLANMKTEWDGARDWQENMFGVNGHNYFVTAYGGFAMAGLLLPEFHVNAPFQALLPDFLEHQLACLMQPDGFTRERAGYHYGTANEFFDLAHLAEINGRTLSPATHAHLRRIAAAGTWKLVTPNGGIPMNGDTGACHDRTRGDCSALRHAAARFELPEAKYVAEMLTADQPAWQPPFTEFLSIDGGNYWPAYQQLSPVAPPSADTCLPESGYYIMRTDWRADADYCFIDAGARGNVVTSHDHAAVFNLEMLSHGRWIFIDNNSGHYGENPARRWRIGSSAHNVATVDDQDHLPILNEWRFGGTVLPFVEHWLSDDRAAYFSGAFEGYQRLESPVVWRRKLFYLRGNYWVLLDRFTASDAHRYTQHFHVAVPGSLQHDGRLLTTGDGGNLLLVPVPGAAGEASLTPNPYPLDGYDNPDCLTYTAQADGNFLFATLLVPFRGECVPEVAVTLAEVEADRRLLSPWEATGLEITIDGRRDLYLDHHLAWNLPWRIGDVRGHRRLFHSQCNQE